MRRSRTESFRRTRSAASSSLTLVGHPLAAQCAAVLVAATALAPSTMTGCSSADDETTVDVYAASSLTDAFAELEMAFEADNPGVDVRLNLAGSSTLLRQIQEGASADVFAPADPALLNEMTDTIVGDVHRYATNRLTLIVPADGESGASARTVENPGDLADESLLVARCAAGVPCGDATDRYLQAAEITIGRSTDEANVRSVLLKVVNGQADAGFVYTTDALARADDVREILLDDPPTVELTVAALSEDADAQSFVAYVASDEAREVFHTLGFSTP